MNENKYFLSMNWGDAIIKAISESEPLMLNYKMYLEHCTFYENDWNKTLLSGLKKLRPKIWQAIPKDEDKGPHALQCICDTLILSGVRLSLGEGLIPIPAVDKERKIRMNIKKPTNWKTAKEMTEKALEVKYSRVTNMLGQIMFDISKAAEEGEFAITIILSQHTKIVTQILEEGGYKVTFNKPDGEYSQYIVTWEMEEEE